MTLNITLASPSYIIQASDRRMVSVPSGNVLDDDANKGLVLKSDDGIFSITFAGVGKWREKRIDLWLAEQMLSQGVPELPIREGLRVIARATTQLFSSLPPGFPKHHTFVMAGFELSGSKPKAAIWTVSNCLGQDGEMLQSASNQFDIQERQVEGRRSLLYITGLAGAVSHNDRKRVEKKLLTSPSPDQVEQVIVDVMKAASSKPEWKWGLNSNVLAIRVAASSQVLATHYPTSARYSRYVPILVWYEAGRNYAAGDGPVHSEKGWRFGPIMYVMPPSSPTLPESKASFLFCYGNAKHKNDPIGEVGILRALG